MAKLILLDVCWASLAKPGLAKHSHANHWSVRKLMVAWLGSLKKVNLLGKARQHVETMNFFGFSKKLFNNALISRLYKSNKYQFPSLLRKSFVSSPAEIKSLLMKGLFFQDRHLMRSSLRGKLLPKFLAAGVRVLGSNCFVCCGGFGSMASLLDLCFFFGGGT